MSKVILIVLLFLGIVIVVSLIGAFILQFAWNIFLHGVFHLPEINYLQSFALMVLLSIVGGSFKAKFNKN